MTSSSTLEPAERSEALALPRVSSAAGTIDLPGSKSISNRALLLAALAEGVTELQGVLASDDTDVMQQALTLLGVELEALGNDVWRVQGGVPWPRQTGELFLGNAGTAFRSLVAALALQAGSFRLSGVPRMHERPIGDLVDALQGLGANIRYLGNPGYPPLQIERPGQLNLDQPVRVAGTVSSQFLTALLMAAPLATQGGRGLVIEVKGELISQPYIAMTLSLMARFGVKVEREGWQRFVVPANASYQSPGALRVEGDASSASYFLALGAIGGGPVTVRGVGRQSIQGDIAFTDTLRAMGASMELADHAIEARGVQVAKGERLKAFDANFNHIPDAAMTAAVLALYADGPCRLREIGSWRVKETDRIHAMQTELQRVGAEVKAGPDWLEVVPPHLAGGWRDMAAIHTYDDHRMAMCFSLAAFGPCAITVLDPNCVSKTFPKYFDAWRSLVA